MMRDFFPWWEEEECVFLCVLDFFHEGLFKKNEKFAVAQSIPVYWGITSEGRVLSWEV